MKKLILYLLLLSSLSFAQEEKFSDHVYKEDSWNIFLYLCEKTNECLGTEAGWSGWGEVKGDNKFVCFFNGEKSSIPDMKVENGNVEKLLSLISECRSNHIKLLDIK